MSHAPGAIFGWPCVRRKSVSISAKTPMPGWNNLLPFLQPHRQRETTPDPVHLQMLLAGMRDRGASHAIVELSLAALIRDR